MKASLLHIAVAAALLPASAMATTATMEDESDLYVQKSILETQLETPFETSLVSLTNDDINRLIRSNLEKPSTIADLMQQYGLTLSRVQKATGYTRQEIIDYINRSRDQILLDYLDRWVLGDTPREESIVTGDPLNQDAPLAFRQPPLNTCGITKPHRTATPTMEQLEANNCLGKYKTAFEAWAQERDMAHQAMIDQQNPVPSSIAKIIAEQPVDE